MNIMSMILVAMMVTTIATRKKYVKIETNLEWWRANEIVYQVIAEVLVSYEKKLMEHMKKYPSLIFKPSMRQETADKIGATYIIDEEDYKETTVKNPYKGDTRYPVESWDDDGNFTVGEPTVDTSEYITQPSALVVGQVFIELAPTLNTLVQDYYEAKKTEDMEVLANWYDKASVVIPLLWD